MLIDRIRIVKGNFFVSARMDSPSARAYRFDRRPERAIYCLTMAFFCRTIDAKRRLNIPLCTYNVHQCDGEQAGFLYSCFEKRGRRNETEPYQKAIPTCGGYRGGGVTGACCGHIWPDKFEDTDAHEDPYDTDTDKAESTDAQEAV